MHLKLSWLWNIGVFMGVSMCEECTHLKHIYVSTCVCFCILFLRWLTMLDTMMCNLLCWWEGRGSRIRGWLTPVWTLQTSHLLPSFLSLLFPGFLYHFNTLAISLKNLQALQTPHDLCNVHSLGRHVTARFAWYWNCGKSKSYVCVYMFVCVHQSHYSGVAGVPAVITWEGLW